jgi:glycosyltransferase 2 family protein
MKSKTRSVIQFILLLGLGILLVWLAVSQVASKKEEIISAFANANYIWVFLSALIVVFSHFVRAYRWNYLLEPLGYKSTFMNSSSAVIIGYFANYGLPRMGELSRCTIVDRYNKIPFQVAFGTVVTERIIDFFVLVLIFVLTLVFQFSELIGLSNQYIFHPLKDKLYAVYQKPVFAIILAIAALGFCMTILIFRKKIAEKFKGKFGNFIKGFWEGLSSARKMKNFPTFIILTLLIWAMYFYSFYVCLYALPETMMVNHKQCLTLMLFGTLGVAFTPGGLGAYHLIIANILMFYGVEQVASVAMPWLVWTAQFVFVLVLGTLALILLPIVNKKKDGPAQKA